MCPGPECLLKLFRAEFSSSADIHTPADARDDFVKKVSLMKRRAKQRKLFGLQMLYSVCGEEWPCNKFFPESIADGSMSLDALVYKFSIKPWCQRRCIYCTAGRRAMPMTRGAWWRTKAASCVSNSLHQRTCISPASIRNKSFSTAERQRRRDSDVISVRRRINSPSISCGRTCICRWLAAVLPHPALDRKRLPNGYRRR